MPRSYIPARDAELSEWAQNLYDRLAVAPENYGVNADQVAPFATAQEAFKAAYAVTSNPATRTTPAIATKNDRKAEMIAAARLLVGTIQSWPAMTDAKRDELQIPVRDNEPTPIGPPTEMPVLRVAAVNGQVVDLEVRREDGQTKRKPVGVRAVWLYSHTGENPPTDLKQWDFRGGSTKYNPQIVFAETATPGTEVWVTALWVNPTDQPGPACAPVKTHINFVGLNQAA